MMDKVELCGAEQYNARQRYPCTSESITSGQSVSRAPFPHNEGARHRCQRRTPQMDAWYALTRYSRFVPV